MKYPKSKPATIGSPKRKKDVVSYKDVDLSVLNNWYESAKEAARQKHWEWFVIDQFLRGNHNIRGNPSDNSIEVTRSKDAVNFPINRIYATFRAVRAFVTRHKPSVMVEPKDSSEEAKTYSRRANRLLERDNQLNNLRKINKEWVYFGIKYGVGYRQIGYDPNRQTSIRWSIDPFDLLSGNKYGEIEDAPYLVKTVIRTVGYLRYRYPKSASEISPDNELAADEYKRLSLQITYGQEATAPSSREEEQTATVKECWYRVYEPNKANGLINKCTYTQTTILDVEETPFTEFPFVSYKSDIVPNEAVGEGHVKHIIAPQRMLNLLNTQLLEYNHIINRGRFLKDKNAGFKVISSKEGQIIEKNPGKMVQVLAPPPLNPVLQYQLGLADQWIEDIGGQHDASQGSAPERLTSGKAIEALQTGDSNNISDLRDNFEDALALEAQWILKMYNLFEEKGILLESSTKDEETDQFAIVGQGAMDKKKLTPKGFYKPKGVLATDFENNGDYCDVCQILSENEVKVSVYSQLGETREAKMDLLFRLLEAGVPLKTVLENLEFPNVSDLMERIAQETLAEQAVNMMGQPPPMGQPPMGPQTPPPPPPEEEVTGELEGIKEELQNE